MTFGTLARYVNRTLDGVTGAGSERFNPSLLNFLSWDIPAFGIQRTYSPGGAIPRGSPDLTLESGTLGAVRFRGSTTPCIIGDPNDPYVGCSEVEISVVSNGRCGLLKL